MGSFMSGMNPNAPTEQAWGMGNMTPEADRTNLDAARKQVMDWFQSQQNPTPMPGNVNPAFRTEDLLKGGLGALIAGLVGGNQGLDAFGQGYLGGKMKKAESDTQQAQQKWQLGNQQAQMADQRKGKMLDFQLQNAEQDYQRAYNESQNVKSQKDRVELEKIRQEGMTKRADLNADGKALGYAMKAMAMKYGTNRVGALSLLHSEGAISDATFIKMKPIAAQEDLGEQVQRQKYETAKVMDPLKKQKLENDITAAISRNSLNGKQAELLQKRLDIFDDEYKLRAANIYSQITSRQNSSLGTGTNAVRKEQDNRLSDLKAFKSLLQGQIDTIKKRYSIGFFSQMPDDQAARMNELQQDLNAALAEEQSIVSSRASGAPSGTPSGQPQGRKTKAEGIAEVQQMLAAKRITQAQANDAINRIKSLPGN